MSENLYNFLAFLQRKGINAICVCITAICAIYGWERIALLAVGTIEAINTLFGIFLTGAYNKWKESETAKEEGTNE